MGRRARRPAIPPAIAQGRPLAGRRRPGLLPRALGAGAVPVRGGAFRLRKLWLLAAGYSALWITTCVLLAVTPDRDPAESLCGFLLIALALAATTHAFVLRETLPARPGLAEPQLPEPAPALVSDPARATCAELQRASSTLQSYVATHAASLPTTCTQLLDGIFVQVDQVLSFVANDGHADAELGSVQALLTDYLPTSLDTYLRLPREYALSQRNPDGRTAAEELELQLRLLRDNAEEAARSLYRGDALRLQEQSVFLESKFGASELDLP